MNIYTVFCQQKTTTTKKHFCVQQTVVFQAIILQPELILPTECTEVPHRRYAAKEGEEDGTAGIPALFSHAAIYGESLSPKKLFFSHHAMDSVAVN